MDVLELMKAGGHPTTWDDFVGQESAKRQLRLKAAGARKKGRTIGHVVLYSPEPGIGKTSLALLMAKEADRGVTTVSSKLSVNEFRYHLSFMDDGDILFWDEFQQQFPKGAAGRKQWEWMLNYMQHGTLVDAYGELESVARVTIVAATTDFGLLPETIQQRVESPIELKAYDWDEQRQISARLAGRILADYPIPAATTVWAIAAAASGKPREMQRLYHHVADLVDGDEVVPQPDEFDAGAYSYDISEALTWAGVTIDGLNSLAQQYLLFLYEECRLEPVGLSRITERLREDPMAIKSTEALLLNKGMLRQSSPGKAGRTLTSSGIKRAKELAHDRIEMAA